MSIALPELPRNAMVKARMLDFGSTLRPQLGGAVQYIGRLGNRFAVDVQLPSLVPAAGRQWVARRLKARTEVGSTLTLIWRQSDLGVDLSGAQVDGAGQAGANLGVQSLDPGQVVPEGAFFSFIAGGRHYLHATTAEVTADGSGLAVLPIAPMLRASPADNAALEFAAPVIEGLLADGPVEWDVERLAIGLSFSLEENR